jgi:adenosylcobinamide-GDP ribazoletransferase
MFRGLVTALRTLSVAPVPGKEAKHMTGALVWFPVAGLLLGALLHGFTIILCLAFPRDWPELVALLVLVAGVLLTHGLHMDGLADCADGLCGTRDRMKALEVMKDSRIGAFGVIAVVAVMLAKWICLVRLVDSCETQWLVVAYVISRLMQVDLASSHPYARITGTGEPFVAGARSIHMGSASIVAILILFGACGFNGLWIVALLLGWGVSRTLGLWCRRRIGGVTGDVLGAGSELIETAVLAVGALMASGGVIG